MIEKTILKKEKEWCCHIDVFQNKDVCDQDVQVKDFIDSVNDWNTLQL